MPKCAICSASLIETTVTVLKCPSPEKHAFGEPKIGSAVIECPLKKGAIWVRVVDETAGKGLELIPVKVEKAPSPGPKLTDPSGFASFDPLDEGEYTVALDLPATFTDDYLMARSFVENVPVQAGQITSVEFKAERVAPLRVKVDHPENFPGKLGIGVAGSSAEYNPTSPATEGKGCHLFPKLRKSGYTVRFTLTPEQKKKFTIEGPDSQPWPHDPYGINEVAFKVIPLKLLKLEVSDAKDLGGDHYWCVADGIKKVKVKAITEPNDKSAWDQLDWTGATKTGEGNEALVDITNTGDFEVKTSLDVPKSVTIEVYDIVSVDGAPLKNIGGTKWKAYKSDSKVTRLKAITKPDVERVWKHLSWNEGTPTTSKQQCDVVLKPVGDRTVTVSLDGKPKTAELHICQWPVLEINQVWFQCHEVLNDGAGGDMGNPFDKKWQAARPDPAPGQTAANSQSPVCFTRNKKVKIGAIFNVTTLSTENETVKVKAALGFGQLEADIAVEAGKLSAAMQWEESSDVVPNKVDCQDAWKIDWTAALEDGAMADAKSSTHLLYVLLGDPQADLYFTLVDMSCRGGKDKTTEDDFVLASFQPFKDSVDDNKGYPRKGDSLKMSYYKQGVATAADDTTYTTAGILSGPDATGRCGGWASLLIHMWKMHGVVASQRWFIRSLNKELLDNDQRFLVKNCDFSSAATLTGLYSHTGDKDLKNDGAPGQGKKNPQFDFSDHVVVKHGGKLYDPSYGMGPYTDDNTYLAAALDGLGSYATGKVLFQQTSDNTEQHIPKECVSYTKGFADFRIGPETLADVAKEYGVTAQYLWDWDPYLKATYATPDKVPAGEMVVIQTSPVTMRRIKTDEITFDMIAAAFGKSKQEIFNHTRNATLSGQRAGPADVVAGDHVIVSWELVPNGGWVIGHDL